MSRAFKYPVLVSALSRFVVPSASPGFASVQPADFRQNFSTAVLRGAPTGFSVSFAPEPDEPLTKASAPSKAPAKAAKGKRKLTKKANPAKKAKPSQEYIAEGGINKGENNTPAVAVVEEFGSNPQAQETHIQVGGGNESATGGNPSALPKDRTVEVKPEDSDLIPHRLSTDALTSNDYLKAQYGGPEGNENRTIEKETITKPPVEPTFVYDDNPINHQTPLSAPAKINLNSLSGGTGRVKKPRTTPEDAKQKKLKKQQQYQPGAPDLRSSLSRAGEDSLKRDSIPKSPKAQPNSKIDIQTKPFPPRKKEPWQVQKQALEKKFDSEGWNPRKKLSPDTIDGIRALHAQYPDEYPTPVLAEKFKISPEAIRRILKSKWRPDPDKQVERRERWARRHDRIWDQQAAIGLRPARTKVKEPKDPSDLEGEAEIGALELARAQTRARDVQLAEED